ncbi:stearoyl-CoA 9-desaturase [Streptomyces capoamus]|uniref:Stearoyl-CoA 9-desaturase n=1 Tax=Streptomyces capoamus TaxID=68183 RepID=A0A919C0R8_9ACTN|nr:fatty acid desaturase [Streptomyces capoamus]GGW14292.1 stearoyl-CoA 9-desaturase [Streptomyces libani subsp. rufus]GHG39337.1 stearoyl-CoA 9-desaturase [Streptomyces capoamus]
MSSEMSSELPGPTPVAAGGRSWPTGEQLMIAVFVAVPFLALVAAVPLAWRHGLSPADLVLAVAFYLVSGLGITVGFHRHFTHGSFKAVRPLRIALALAGSLAVQGPLITWVADHRKHHKYSDRDGDPHSPWRYGHSARALAKGMLYAHLGWLFETEHASPRTYAPDLVRDRALMLVSRRFGVLVLASLALPALCGAALTRSWQGALSAFFWAGLVRICLVHHVTWSINSICHATGSRPFRSRDRSGNVWWLAPLSFGESWHNLHHADPTSARHGVLTGQLDASARLIRWFERLGWAHDVRWPDADRVTGRRKDTT